MDKRTVSIVGFTFGSLGPRFTGYFIIEVVMKSTRKGELYVKHMSRNVESYVKHKTSDLDSRMSSITHD